MRFPNALFWSVLAAAAFILALQLLVPPIVGLADQGDFARVIGKFGYGPAPTPTSLRFAFVPAKYVPDPSFASPTWEHATSEYLFVAIAVAVNRAISRDGSLDDRLVGIVHILAFLGAFGWFLWATRNLQWHVLLWIAALIALTDVGYAAYWNSFYTEPASMLFCLVLFAETIDMCKRGVITPASLVRWTLWAVLWILAKPQNAPVALPLVLLLSRFRVWSVRPVSNPSLVACAGAIVATAAITVGTLPPETRKAPVYDTIFMAVLPESKNPAADLRALGLDPQLARFSGTGAWSPGTAYSDPKLTGDIGTKVTFLTVARFYLLRPARFWRHIRSALPRAMWLRPEWCGNFEQEAGFAPGARSTSFSLWSRFHEQVLTRIARLILFALAASLLAAILRRRHITGLEKRRLEAFLCLTTCCLLSFLAAVFGDAWDNVKHLLIFNFLLDGWLLFGASLLGSVVSARLRIGHGNLS